MRQTLIRPLIALASLTLTGLACALSDAQRPVEISGATSTAQYVATLEAQLTENAREATAAVGTLVAQALTGTPEPSLTPTPCFLEEETGLCIPEEAARLLMTATPEFNLPEPILTVRARSNVRFASQPGESFSATVLGRFASGATWIVHKSVSGFPESSEGDNPEKDPCKDHYYGIYLVGWLERIDTDENLSLTTGIEHNWGHPNQTHAHLVDSQGRLIAQIDPYPGVRIIKILGQSSDGTLLNVILQLVWVRAENVTVVEGCK